MTGTLERRLERLENGGAGLLPTAMRLYREAQSEADADRIAEIMEQMSDAELERFAALIGPTEAEIDAAVAPPPPRSHI